MARIADITGAILYEHISDDPFYVLQDAANNGIVLNFVELYNEFLAGVDLAEASLAGACLSRSNLHNSNLSYADLSGADLRGADLSGANLKGAWLRGANLSDANISEANLEGADLRGANLEGILLDGAKVAGADLRLARVYHTDNYITAEEKAESHKMVVDMWGPSWQVSGPIHNQRSWASGARWRNSLVIGEKDREENDDQNKRP